MVLGVDPTDPARRVVSVAKTNYREPDNSISFALASNAEFEVGYVDDARLSDVVADQLTTAPATADEKTERSEARDFLLERLADGPLPSEEVIKAAQDVGISKRTLERARKELGVTSRRRSDPDTGRAAGWEMALHAWTATPPTHLPALPVWRSGRCGCV